MLWLLSHLCRKETAHLGVEKDWVIPTNKMASSPGKNSNNARQSTFAFRLINPELFIRPNKVIMVGGSVALIGCFLYLGYMNLTGGGKQTVSVSVQSGQRAKSKWD